MCLCCPDGEGGNGRRKVSSLFFVFFGERVMMRGFYFGFRFSFSLLFRFLSERVRREARCVFVPVEATIVVRAISYPFIFIFIFIFILFCTAPLARETLLPPFVRFERSSFFQLRPLSPKDLLDSYLS